MQGDRVLIFTDASLEGDDETAGVGMVAFIWKAGELSHRLFFSEKVPLNILRSLQTHTPKVIAALELLAAVMAVDVLRPHVKGSRLFVFVDNEAARANLISMSSPVTHHVRLLRALFEIVSHRSLFMWISRVPSASNVADGPSRFVFEDLLSQGFKRVEPGWHVVEV